MAATLPRVQTPQEVSSIVFVQVHTPFVWGRASIGGLATLIGTPPNALLAAFMLESYGIEIGFARWMAVGLPLVVVSLPLTWLILTRVVFPIRIREIPGGAGAIDAEYAKLGPISRAERSVAVIFVVTAVLLAWAMTIGGFIALATDLWPSGGAGRVAAFAYIVVVNGLVVFARWTRRVPKV